MQDFFFFAQQYKSSVNVFSRPALYVRPEKKSTEVRTPLSAVLISSDDKRKVSNGMVTDD